MDSTKSNVGDFSTKTVELVYWRYDSEAGRPVNADKDSATHVDIPVANLSQDVIDAFMARGFRLTETTGRNRHTVLRKRLSGIRVTVADALATFPV